MEDRDLREELSQLLGLPRREFFEVEVSPRMIALAEDLRREASRRRNTTRQRPMWLLLAAALPVAMTLGALGSWGYQHKQRAEALAAAVTAKEIAIQQMAQTAAVAAAQLKASQAPVAPVAATSTATPSSTPSPTRVARVKPRPGELVIEVKPSTSSMPTQTQTVKQRGQ
jgi:hypothetical protein